MTVGGWSCHGGRNQMWGLDGTERYHSRVNPGYGLTVNDHNQLTQDICTTSLAQKWYWEDDKLKTRYRRKCDSSSSGIKLSWLLTTRPLLAGIIEPVNNSV
ncbi:ricin-type beta-trefoil lectin domain protein [Endozoicomonas atrinae]|uniref:ricin-type beta-trefoil lectin domain protein n=1 Tax=Endozoicomonas atrinae TaxID=1333660 RepID=UPI001112F340